MERISKTPHFESKTFLITSNNPKVFEYCDRVLHLERGKIVFDGKYSEAKFKIEQKDEEELDLGGPKLIAKQKVIFLKKLFRSSLMMKLKNMSMKLKEEQLNLSIWKKISQQ